MANLRNLKKEIDYRLEEVVFDCDMAICFQPSKEKEKHYAALRAEMDDVFGKLFEKLSKINEKK